MHQTAEQLARMPLDDAAKYISSLTANAAEAALRSWHFWRLAAQAEPKGDWGVWLVMAGRGFGKTRMGAEWVRERAEADGKLRIALVGATLSEVRNVMVEGESGMLASAANGVSVEWEPSLKKITWANGAVAHIYSAAEPESLRGPQHHLAWADEIAKWPYGIDAWNNLMFGLRVGVHPQVMATTTPRPVPLIRRLLQDRAVQRTVGRTIDNAANLPESYLRTMQATYGGTRLGRQELDGELIEDADGALWTRDRIEACRVRTAPDLVRVVIGVDPPASSTGDACGIVAAGLCAAGQGWVLADESVSGESPEGWARAVAVAAARWQADRVIAEKNNGGEMVESVLRAADVAMPVRLVHASKGKVPRAEPVAALYEKGRIHHAGAFPALEDELCGLIVGGGYEGPGRSPDRADALVWAMTELMLGKRGEGPRVRVV